MHADSWRKVFVLGKVFSLIRRMRSVPHSVDALSARIAALERKTDALTAMSAQLLERSQQDGSINLNEFRVFSQWGEDGILSYLVDTLRPENTTFVEFGVENYTEASTRWLLQRRNWSGLVIDGSDANVQSIRSSAIYWQQQLKAVSAFITRENINEILERNGMKGEIGLLSIDIDGVDYWVWEAIQCVSPIIVVVEYNSLFGPDRCVTVPYRADFMRSKASETFSYYGASLGALVSLGKKKNYAFVGSNLAGNNAFFVRKDYMRAPLRELTCEEGYVKRSFREARGPDGQFLYPTFEEEQQLISNLPLVDVTQ